MTKADLHERLKFAVDIRLSIARAASPGPWEYATVRGVTSIGQPYVLPSVAADVAHDADVHYLVAHDPTTMIRLYERDLKVLERHHPIRHSADKRDWPDVWRCEACDEMCHSETGLMCDNPDAPYPCDEIKDLAAAYEVELTP